MTRNVLEMSMADQLKLVRDRRIAVEREIEHCIARIAALKAELPDLQVTERTLARLAGSKDQPADLDVFPWTPENEPETKPITTAQLAAALNGGGKPSGLPTTPDMIMKILIESHRRGEPGLEPKDITRAIARRWWPSVKSEDVSPIMWRMFKRGQIASENGIYTLAKHTEAADLLGEDSAAS